jgi:hypothetical protein
MSIFVVAMYGQSMATSFGAKAGVNFTSVANAQVSNLTFTPGMKTDFHLGAVANFHFGYRSEGSPVGTGLFGLQTELLYSRQGFTWKDETVRFDYLTLPVMAKYYATRQINIEAGPYIGYLINVAPDATLIDGTHISFANLKGGIDAGIAVGAGYEALSGFIVGARYMLGLTEMTKNLPWRNSGFALSVGWLF